MTAAAPRGGPAEERFPLLQIMIGNSFLLSAIYLAGGLVVELVRRIHPSEAVVRMSVALDRLPAGVLEAVGLLGPLREAYLQNDVGALMLRLVFGLTTVALIFALALGVGGGMWLALAIQQRRQAGPGGRA
ncbi:MAG TPA: hypothetical protein VND93_09625 [Myxococcales bacterium]|nr:hypothetical protein [Myxococcales bacterium]